MTINEELWELAEQRKEHRLSEHRKRHKEKQELIKTVQDLQKEAMTTNKPLFRFNTQVAESDPTGYCITRWDRVLAVSVIAHNRDEAFKKVRTMMGDPPHYRTWDVRIDSAEEIVNENQ